MTKTERVDASLAGREVDRPPISFWYHFGVQHAPGTRIAELSLEFLRYYDLDFLKLMNDYYFPMPDGLSEVNSAAALGRIRPIDIQKSDWALQLDAIDILARELKDEAYFIDTVFDPWQVLRRSLAGEHFGRLMNDHPQAVLSALEAITESVIEYCQEAIKRGAAGVFVSTFGAAQQMSQEQYRTFAKPFVKQIFEELNGKAPMNTLHMHDYGIFIDDIQDIPIDILSYEDRYPSNPSIPEMRHHFDGSIMAGLDKWRLQLVTTADAVRNAMEGVELGGSSKFLLAPGCSFEAWFDPHSAKAMVDAVQALGR